MIAVLLAEGFEEIEALTVVDILRRGGCETKMAGVGGMEITGAHGICVTADTKIEDIKEIEVEAIVLPGGMPGTLNLQQSKAVEKLLNHCVTADKVVAAICAAPLILGEKGLLRGRKAVCFPGFEPHLKGAHLSSERVVLDGRFLTSKGPGTASDFGFALLELLCGRGAAAQLKKDMQYDA